MAHGPRRLDGLRIASPCHQRWADMVGGDQVRSCAACERPVFDLSAMTRAQAESVLAAPGATPCVRFARGADGAVVTTDHPHAARLRLAMVASAAAASLLAASPAFADPPAPPPAGPAEAPPADAGSPGPPPSAEYTTHIPFPGPTFEVNMGIPPRSIDDYGLGFSGQSGLENRYLAESAWPQPPPSPPPTPSRLPVEWSTWFDGLRHLPGRRPR